MPVGCGLGQWCETCGFRKAKRIRRKVLRGFGEAHKRAMAAWSKARKNKPGVKLITLTVRPSGEGAAHDRAVITRGWQRFRAWLHPYVGAPSFALAWEVTDGESGSPHVHAHVAMIAPFIPVKLAAAAWVRATNGAAEAQGFDMRFSTSEKAAKYTAKYATKGCDSGAVSRATFVEWVSACSEKRSYTTSRGLLSAVTEPSRPPCCASDGVSLWGGAQIRKGADPDQTVSGLPTGPPDVPKGAES